MAFSDPALRSLFEDTDAAPAGLSAWQSRLAAAPSASIILQSKQHHRRRASPPEQQLNLTDNADLSRSETDVFTEIQKPHVWEIHGPASIGQWTRRFEIRAWSAQHAWFDAKYADKSPAAAIVKKARRLTLVVSLAQYEDLGRWVDTRRFSDHSSTLLFYAESLLMLDVCIVKWESDIAGSRGERHGVTERSHMLGLDDFVSWLHRRISPDVRVTFVKPDRIHDVESLGAERGLRNYSFLDPAVGDITMRFARQGPRDDSVQPIQLQAEEELLEARHKAKENKRQERRLREQRKLVPTHSMAEKKKEVARWENFVKKISAPVKKPKPYVTPGLRIK